MRFSTVVNIVENLTKRCPPCSNKSDLIGFVHPKNNFSQRYLISELRQDLAVGSVFILTKTRLFNLKSSYHNFLLSFDCSIFGFGWIQHDQNLYSFHLYESEIKIKSLLSMDVENERSLPCPSTVSEKSGSLGLGLG